MVMNALEIVVKKIGMIIRQNYMIIIINVQMIAHQHLLNMNSKSNVIKNVLKIQPKEKMMII